MKSKVVEALLRADLADFIKLSSWPLGCSTIGIWMFLPSLLIVVARSLRNEGGVDLLTFVDLTFSSSIFENSFAKKGSFWKLGNGYLAD